MRMCFMLFIKSVIRFHTGTCVTHICFNLKVELAVTVVSVGLLLKDRSFEL